MKHILNEKIENNAYLKAFVEDKEELNDSLTTQDKISYLDFKISQDKCSLG